VVISTSALASSAKITPRFTSENITVRMCLMATELLLGKSGMAQLVFLDGRVFGDNSAVIFGGGQITMGTGYRRMNAGEKSIAIQVRQWRVFTWM
jgi:hypothetical protein